MDSNQILELRSVYKDFDGLKVLSNINITISFGERHAIIGPNGAGKSTLFNLLTGKYKLSSGAIIYKGKEIGRKSIYELNRLGISRSFQITNIFRTRTVFENIRYAVLSKMNVFYNFFLPLSRMTSVTKETDDILERIDLYSRKEVVAGQLSYGEQRKLEIGLALATDPELIFLDEPTAGMSSDETRETVKLIDRISQGKTLIIVEHDMEVVFSLADRISVLYYGQIICSDRPDVVRTNQQVKDAYLGEEGE